MLKNIFYSGSLFLTMGNKSFKFSEKKEDIFEVYS